jgi:hypothetical protein
MLTAQSRFAGLGFFMKKTNKSKLNYRVIIKAELIIIVICVILASFQIYHNSPKVREAVAMATTKKPETFTELYFEDHLSLPAFVTLNKNENFKFTIHNLEYKDMSYPYEVFIVCRDPGCMGDKQLIDKGTAVLKHDEYKTINEDYTIGFPTKRIQVVVNLVDKNQQITFWTNGEKE